jgi:hypothetical protein
MWLKGKERKEREKLLLSIVLHFGKKKDFCSFQVSRLHACAPFMLQCYSLLNVSEENGF